MSEQHKFAGEDEHAGFATPVQDLIAAAFLIALSLWIMVESVRLTNPGSLSTTPGLLPFLTAGSLCVMALILGTMALRRRAAGATAAEDDEKPEHVRTAMLAAFIGAYLLALQYLNFEYSATIAGMELGYGGFEVITIVFLTVILAIFWTGVLWKCLLVSAVWITLLAAAFRYVFAIPLPGSL
ncbi:tripartite tricarboxylate transporter TctB family protein [Hoeflea poritis]|uniref:Tripartite tricarboxylate transporter TctB family protein n=1 Tax=Hoeflea poritis TaxID=2993659 RepID=A0ABT4VIA9_9HYPH|nr:tripartite tricarboxylate transporter TctB family protein [Hoeflea poritis]MDA4844452.1 tripartite tricarboxylate transporter TctB family protein [Hoeflea poritis]